MSLNPAVENRESATLGITFEKHPYPPRRSDFVFWKGWNWECVKYENKGQDPVKDDSGNAVECARGVNGYLYASDHLAVLVEFGVIKGEFAE